jgi:hypothetical protein
MKALSEKRLDLMRFSSEVAGLEAELSDGNVVLYLRIEQLLTQLLSVGICYTYRTKAQPRMFTFWGKNGRVVKRLNRRLSDCDLINQYLGRVLSSLRGQTVT